MSNLSASCCQLVNALQAMQNSKSDIVQDALNRHRSLQYRHCLQR